MCFHTLSGDIEGGSAFQNAMNAEPPFQTCNLFLKLKKGIIDWKHVLSPIPLSKNEAVNKDSACHDDDDHDDHDDDDDDDVHNA